jgi:two-component system alkaline phosphatase synthesis response regulator PhoP
MGERRKILVVDDEPHIVELVSMYLHQSGYDSCSARDGESAISMAIKEGPDLVLLDLMLPGIGGLETCRLLRQDARTAKLPIIMLTAKSEESDKVIGLGVGADDYITKPFGLRELVARIEVALRHASPAAPARAVDGVIRVEGLAVDEAGREVSLDGERVALSPTEFDLLALLARQAGRAVRRQDIVRDLDMAGASQGARSLDVHIRNIRRKLGDRSGARPWVETVRGFGYKIDA